MEDIIIYENEINVKDRCHRLGISMEQRTNEDRFKWLALINMLKLRENHPELYSDEMIDYFFQHFINKVPDIGYKNPLACILVYYISKDEKRLEFVKKILIPEKELLFQNQGLRFIDLIRYIRLFEPISWTLP